MLLLLDHISTNRQPCHGLDSTNEQALSLCQELQRMTPRTLPQIPSRVPNCPSELQSFGARHRSPVWSMTMEELVHLGERSPGPRPSTDDHSLDQGRILYIQLGNESSETYSETNLQRGL